ncbi:hypothetical protein FACS1894147_10140 [Spirochaetia bacterium]|nr:hypothetical protein FACS1894147_10110 [Spirochaetia bacterium]GHU04721.1 hypothetical protein FACS1894147_10140 [Spirochaetia bacterium]
MARNRTLRYYLKKVPHKKEVFEDGSFEDAIEDYKRWKLEIVAYYEHDEKLKKSFLEAYNILITKEITDEEMDRLKEEYKKITRIYSDKLLGSEYELD